jgi:molecular chaperone HscB
MNTPNTSDETGDIRGQDPFSVLGLARRFDVSDGVIESAFLRRLAAAHPDLAGEHASHDAAALTEARSVLLDPERRAGALLALMGGASAGEDASLPDGFLMEIMELRAQVEDELGAGDDTVRDRWESFAAQRRAAHIDAVGLLFAGLGDDPTREQLATIRTELNAWRYTERLIEQLDPGYDPGHADFS